MSESAKVVLGRVFINAGIRRMSALGALEKSATSTEFRYIALAAIFEASPIYQVLPSTKIKSSSEC